MLNKAYDNVNEIRTFADLAASEKQHRRKLEDYCFDEAWFATQHPRKYALIEKAEDKFIQIACQAIEEDASYGSSEHGIQSEMYGILLNIRNVPKKYRGKLTSEDRMTNFVFVFNQVVALLEDKERTYFPESSFAQDWPEHRYSRGTFFKKGYSCFTHQFEKPSKGYLRDLEKTFEAFARCSSMLGNYCCMPSELKELYLNAQKPHLKLAEEMRVNDQFAPFLEWLSENKFSCSENNLIDTWKRAMLLDCCEGYYRQAFWYYKQSVLSDDHQYRLVRFTEYLKCVNAAIKLRSKEIVKKITS